MFLVVNEAAEGLDGNGDGDLGDDVLQVLDLRRPGAGPRNLGISVETLLGTTETVLWFQVAEVDEGRDLDGDGAVQGELTYLYDVVHEALVPSPVRFSSSFFFLLQPPLEVDGHLVYAVQEEPGEDLNGDGDRNDDVVFVVVIE